MYKKRFPREPIDTITGNPCTLMDGNFLIWTSTMFMFCRYKMKKNDDEE
jgi:hypothetical protein